MKRILIPLLVFAGLAIVLITSGWFYFEQKVINPSPEAIPNNLAALPLMDQMTGRQASRVRFFAVTWQAVSADFRRCRHLWRPPGNRMGGRRALEWDGSQDGEFDAGQNRRRPFSIHPDC
jgi:hypothetical protein